MPNHDYECNCGIKFQKFNWIEDLEKEKSLHPECPGCGGFDTQRQLSLIARTPNKWKVEKDTT